MIREHKVQKSEEKQSDEKSAVQKSPGQVRSENLREGLGGMSFPAQKAVLDPNVLSTAPVQRKKDGESSSNVQSVASWGVRGAGTTLPHAGAIQKSFGSHDVSGGNQAAVQRKEGSRSQDFGRGAALQMKSEGAQQPGQDLKRLQHAFWKGFHEVMQQAKAGQAAGTGDLQMKADPSSAAVVQRKGNPHGGPSGQGAAPSADYGGQGEFDGLGQADPSADYGGQGEFDGLGQVDSSAGSSGQGYSGSPGNPHEGFECIGTKEAAFSQSKHQAILDNVAFAVNAVLTGQAAAVWGAFNVGKHCATAAIDPGVAAQFDCAVALACIGVAPSVVGNVLCIGYGMGNAATVAITGQTISSHMEHQISSHMEHQANTPSKGPALGDRFAGAQNAQRKEDGSGKTSPGGSVQQIAAQGVQGGGSELPHADAIQKSFGSHDVSGVRAHVGGQAQSAAQEIGAKAYATGNDVAFSGSPDLHTTAHEAAHVVQQKAGVSLKGGVGEVGDKYEQHADAVADAVVQGKSAESLLSKMAGSGGGANVQMKKEGKEKEPFDQWNLSADVKALFVELGKAKTDKDREAIVNKLHTNHRVPKAIIGNVVAGEKGVFGDLWKNLKGGSWSQANVDESGAITSTFKLDKKGLGWETATYGVTVNDKGEATYTDKDDHWSLAAERAKNHGMEGGKVTYNSGTKETGTTEIEARGGGGDGSGYGGGTYTTTKGDDKKSVSADVLGGKKTGVIGSATVNSKDRDISANADAVRTEKDSGTSTTVGASATTTDKSKETPVTVNASGRVTQNENNNGDESTKIEVGGGYKEGSANVSGTYANTTGTAGGNAYTVNELSFSLGDSYSLGNPELNKDLSLKLTGGLRLTNELEKESTFNTTLSGILTEGKGDDKETLNFSIFGGKATAGDIAGKTNLNDGLIGGDKSYGYYGGGSFAHSAGLNNYSGSLTGGITDETTMLGLNAGYSHLSDDKKSKDVELNLYAGLALQDNNYAALIRTNNKFALSKDFDLGIGGKFTLQPTDEGHKEIWSAYSSLGYNLDKDKTLTLTMGIADNGEQISYIPGVMFTQDNKHTAQIMASIPESGGKTTVGGKYTHEKSGLSVFGGYGDMNTMSNPYYGNSGMGMPMNGDDVLSHRDGGVFIGVQVDAIKLFKKVFGD